MQTNIYTLPELTFVGGKTQELNFNLYERNGNLFNAKYCNSNFSVCNYSNKCGTPLFSIQPIFVSGDDNVAHILQVVIPAEQTLNLYGKYIYQITIADNTGRIEIPNQGIMNITRNINQGFVLSLHPEEEPGQEPEPEPEQQTKQEPGGKL